MFICGGCSLVRHASTAAVRAAAFGADEELDAAGRERGPAGRPPPAGRSADLPARRAAETAAELDVGRVEPALAECDFGAWAGRSLADVAQAEPDAVHAWMTDPDAAPHGGESLTALLARVRTWMAAEAEQDGTAIAITHGGVVKAAVVTALDAPPSAFLADRRLSALHLRAPRPRRSLDRDPRERARS